MITKSVFTKRTSGRWTANDKLRIVSEISRGVITRDQVLKTFPDISPDELSSWFTHFEKRGINGLRANRLQEGRNVRQREARDASAR